MSPPSSSMAAEYGPCFLTVRKRSRLLKANAWGNFSTAATWSTGDWMQNEINLLVGPLESLLATVKREKLADLGHVTRHDSLCKSILRSTLEGGRCQGLAEEVLDGQHQRVDIPAHARTAHKGILQKILEEDLCWIVPPVPPTTQSVKGLNWTDVTFVGILSMIAEFLDRHCLWGTWRVIQ